jgi:hypothetical protein
MSESHDAYIVVTSDGVLFRCDVESIDTGRMMPDDRWIFARGDGLRFVGPPAVPIATVDEMRELVERWWQDRKAGRTPIRRRRRCGRSCGIRKPEAGTPCTAGWRPAA